MLRIDRRTILNEAIRARMRYFETDDSAFQAMANPERRQQRLMTGWQAIERGEAGPAEAIARELLLQGRGQRDALDLLAYNLLAVSLMQQARHHEALEALGSALERDPRSPGTLLNLGSALTQMGRHAEAIPHLRKAAELDPRLSPAHNNLGHALKELGRFGEAADSYERALKLAPEDVEVRNNLGTVLAALGRREEAVASYRAALALDPDFPPALNNLGVALDEMDRHGEALECFTRAVTRDPRNADAHTNMGIAHQRMGRTDEAIACHRTAIAIDPRFAAAHLNLGLAFTEKGQLAAAVESFQGALSLDPGSAEAHAQLGIAHRTLGRLTEAIALLEKAISIKPDHVAALIHLGAAYQQRGMLERAVPLFERAVALDPESADARHNLGVALQGLSRHEEAIACFEGALRLDPMHRYTLGALLWSQRRSCRWDGLAARTSELRAAVRKGLPVTEPFTLLAVSGDPEEQLLCARAFRKDKMRTGAAAAWSGERRPREKIRLAYLSADFREHAVAYCTAELFGLHDRSRFEVIGVSFGADDGSPMRAGLASSFDRFLDVRERDDAEVAGLLKDLQVDIAVDLTGYTAGGRTGILSFRPAPVQAEYLGFPGTTGADFVDYLIADRFLIPEPDRRHYSEQVVFLPDSYMVNPSRRAVAEPLPRRADAGLPETGFVFCCFNNSHKIDPDVFDAWMRLLSQVEGSVLWLAGGNAAAEANLRSEAARRGVDPRRLVFASFVRRIEEHYARLHLGDLFLDTPYNGHVTTADALWAGLPVLTWAGTAFAGRVAGSLLHSLNLAELVVRGLEEYEATALALATDARRLAELRAKLQKNGRSAHLFDADRFRRHIESAYATMWDIWLRGEAPRSFSVPAIG